MNPMNLHYTKLQCLKVQIIRLQQMKLKKPEIGKRLVFKIMAASVAQRFLITTA